MSSRGGRLAVLTVVVATSTAVFCGVAQADDDNNDDDTFGSSQNGVDNTPVKNDDEEDTTYRSRGGVGGEPGENGAECGAAFGPGSGSKQCKNTRPAQRGADGLDRIVF